MMTHPCLFRKKRQRGIRNRALRAAVLGATAGSVAVACPPVCLDVSQGKRFYGRFAPIATPTSVEDFYHYKHYSFNGDDIVPLLVDQSLILVHHFDASDDEADDARACDLSLVIVHDSKDDATGGQVLFEISGNHEEPLVQDGPGDGSKSDLYVYAGDEVGRTELFWEWGWQGANNKKYRTDGMADTWLSETDSATKGCLEVSAKFIAGIDAWRFVPGPVDGHTGMVSTDDYLYLDKDDTLRICKVDCSS